MSRISYSEDEDYPGQFNIWQANCRRSLRGRKGQAALRELEAALLAMPDKRLWREVLVEPTGEVCAIGAAMVERKVAQGMSREQAIAECAAVDPYDSQEAGERLGMPRLVAWKVVEWNDIQMDGYYGPQSVWVEYTPEERYAKVLAFVRSELTPADPAPSETPKTGR